MGNTLTLAVNKIKYQMDNYLKDPEAENHAKQLAAQAAQNEKVAKAKAAAANIKAIADAKAAEAKIAAEELAKRSKFSSPQIFASKIASNILSIFGSLIIICLALYAGKIEANRAIGYNVPMRIVSFIYGALFFFIVIPKSLYDIYVLDKTIPDYAALPIWNYVPNGWTEQIFFGAFSYVEDANSKAARQEVMRLYNDGFTGITTRPALPAPPAATGPTGPTGPTNPIGKTPTVTNSKSTGPTGTQV